jgi:hypothetical protein
MKYATRLAWGRYLHLNTEAGLRQRYCACRRPIDSHITPDIRKALDDLEEAMASEPADEDAPGGVAD